MSYEKKIKDLMLRLVSMSPEPPPYPEEMHMARHEAARKRNPALVFAGAAVLVALLAVPLLLFTGGEDPIVTGSSTTTTSTVAESTTTIVADTTTTSISATSTTERLVEPWTGVVFLYQQPENSFLGNPALVPIAIEVVDPSGGIGPGVEFTEALSAIADELGDGMSNAIPSDVQVLARSTEDDHLAVEMNRAFLDGAATPGLLSDFTMLNQLVYTLTYSDPGLEVQFLVDGEPVEAFGTEGIELTTPVGRDDFLDQAGVIFLTRPIAETEGVYTVAGMANTFEASLAVDVLDQEGTPVHSEFVQATCGSGCWGEFAVDIDADVIEPGVSSVRVFTHSAEDGSVIEAITVPIPEAVVWQFTVGG